MACDGMEGLLVGLESGLLWGTAGTFSQPHLRLLTGTRLFVTQCTTKMICGIDRWHSLTRFDAALAASMMCQGNVGSTHRKKCPIRSSTRCTVPTGDGAWTLVAASPIDPRTSKSKSARTCFAVMNTEFRFTMRAFRRHRYDGDGLPSKTSSAPNPFCGNFQNHSNRKLLSS